MKSWLNQNPAYGKGDDVPLVSDTIYMLVMAANTSRNILIPAGANYVAFYSDSADFFAKFGVDNTVVAAIAVADVTDGTASIPNPTILRSVGYTYVALIAAQATNITMSFYK